MISPRNNHCIYGSRRTAILDTNAFMRSRNALAAGPSEKNPLTKKQRMDYNQFKRGESHLQNNSTPTNKPKKGNKNPKLLIQLGIAVIIIIAALFLVIPRVQANIRLSQVESLVDVDFSSKKVKFADTKTIEKEIKDSRAITVVFSVPSGKTYDRVISLFEDEEEMKMFSRSLTVYPIIYDASEIEKQYNIKKEDVTVIFFEGGKERNRFIVESTMDVKTELILKLNELPLAIVESDAPIDTPTDAPTTESAAPEPTEPEPTAEQLHQEKLQTVQ
ncbi:hypothetical protein LI951_01745 [Enterococcus sp. BWT-B8]|uniref:hypothetical protein n=1 Tax=Enterococcus sp. BWT-B8 TaxID=2885157 RepID=UPI001E51D137|nr:hypothetical protein [Enterococcus sp. BWT-B8]MCB5950786.1 hypothetical protein [Enterococcus sp. BWT-B8]